MNFNLNIYADLLPKTFKDVLDARNNIDGAEGEQKVQAQKIYDEKFTALATRVTIAAVATLAVVAWLDILVTIAFTAVILSLPAAALTFSFIGTGLSVFCIVDSLATGLIFEFGLGVVFGAVSYGYADIAGGLPRWGIVEYTLEHQSQHRTA